MLRQSLEDQMEADAKDLQEEEVAVVSEAAFVQRSEKAS